MLRCVFVTIGVVLFLSIGLALATDKPVNLAEVADRRGQVCTVEIRVEDTSLVYSGGTTPRLDHISLIGGDRSRQIRSGNEPPPPPGPSRARLPKPPKGVVLFVEIAGDRVSRFKPSNPDNLAEHYRNKWIRVTGKIEVEGDGDSGDKDVVIKVVDQAQITVIDKRK